MAFANQIKALVQSHAEGDSQRFFSVAMQVAANEARKGHGKLAQELKDIIDSARSKSGMPDRDASAIPISRPQGELAELFSFVQPEARLNHLVFQPDIKAKLQRVLKEQKHIAQIKAQGLHPRQRLLFVGPPGCGKTITANALAGEMGVPLFVVRLESLITKYMGETSVKLRLVFDAISQTRAVYLFDEFDSIGTQRGHGHDVGEMRRILNSFLVFIDSLKTTSLIIAATNHAETLDHALFRRFDDVIEYKLPDTSMIETLIQNRLASFDAKEVDYGALAKVAEGLNCAEIVKACDEAAKEVVVGDRSVLDQHGLESALAAKKSYRFSK